MSEIKNILQLQKDLKKLNTIIKKMYANPDKYHYSVVDKTVKMRDEIQQEIDKNLWKAL